MDQAWHIDRSLHDLQWSELCEKIAGYAHTDLAKSQIQKLQPADDQETAATRLSVLREALFLAQSGAAIPAGMVRDGLGSVERIRRQVAASAEELLNLKKTLFLAGVLDRFGEQHEEAAPVLGRVLAVSQELGPLARALDEAIDDEGQVRDGASPGLLEARTQLVSVRRQLQKRIEELVGRYREALSDGFYAEREGRYVLPVRADAPFRVEGTVLDTSASASTLYVEPREIAPLGNKLRILQLRVAEEEALVLASLCVALSPHADEIQWAQEVCVRADLLAACVKFARAIDARVVPFGDPGTLSLKQARHPLLCLENTSVVANDFELGAASGLVLSGPNAGGKTVALKTLGLMALMQSSGLPVPVDEESAIGFFSEVLSDIGDDQSLAMSLSTFSGHIERVASILSDAAHGTLVLFDELMGGTDPNEGAALAIATIDELVEAGATVCVTTHYEALKEHAASAPNIQNAAVGFDFSKMEPTFTVEMGRPGASSAFIVAQRHGLAGSITKRAEEILPDVLSETRQDRLELEQQAILLRTEREHLRVAVVEHESETRRLALEREKVKEARLKDLGRESDALRAEVSQARADLRSLRQRLKSTANADLKEMERAVAKASAVVALGSSVDREVRGAVSEDAKAPFGALVVGTLVYVKGFSSPAKVLEAPKKGQVKVLAGVMKMSVPVSELERRGGGSQSSAASPSASTFKKAQNIAKLAVGPRVPPVKSNDVILDLRGRRVEESLLELDQFIDELLQRQETGGFVLHGHGTGALKEAVRLHLRAHCCIAEATAAERDDGGDAWTTFWLEM